MEMPTTNEWTKTGQKVFVVGIIALLMTSAAPTASADRATGAETAGVYHGYRMVDDAEPDGPTGSPTWIEGTESGEIPPGDQKLISLPLPFPVYGCPNVSVWINEDGLYFDDCNDQLGFEGSSSIQYDVSIGLDSREVAASIIWLGMDGFDGVVTMAVDGTVHVHLSWTDGPVVWSPAQFSEELPWQPAKGWGNAKWEPYGILENEGAPDLDLLIPGMNISVAPGGVSVPGVPPQTIGPVGTDPIPVGTPEQDVPKTCTPVVPVLCVGPFTVPGQDFGEVPGVGPTDPVTTPGVPPTSVPTPVDLEVGFSDIRVFASSDVPEPGVWEGTTVVVPVPIIDEDVPVEVCPDGCPFPILPEHEVYGSVYVRGSVDGTPVDVTVPFEIAGGPGE